MRGIVAGLDLSGIGISGLAGQPLVPIGGTGALGDDVGKEIMARAGVSNSAAGGGDGIDGFNGQGGLTGAWQAFDQEDMFWKSHP